MEATSPSTSALSNTGKRVRTSKPKVRSGCITCKSRRIKCDEAKPVCDRCSKFGRVCGGYSKPQSYEDKGTAKPEQSILPKIENSSSPSPSNFIGEQSTASQRVAVRYGLTPNQQFCVEASIELCRFLEQPHWISNSLEICKQHRFVRHAFSAIHLLSKPPSSYSASDPSLALVTTIDNDLLTEDKALATQHCEQFLHCEQEALPNGYNDSTLTKLSAFILLLRITLDTLQFQAEAAFVDIQASLTLLKELLDAQNHAQSGVGGNIMNYGSSDIMLDNIAIQELIGMIGVLKAKTHEMDAYVMRFSRTPTPAPTPLLASIVPSRTITPSEPYGALALEEFPWNDTSGMEPAVQLIMDMFEHG